jgi:predicted secreted acid phosphatase
MKIKKFIKLSALLFLPLTATPLIYSCTMKTTVDGKTFLQEQVKDEEYYRTLFTQTGLLAIAYQSGTVAEREAALAITFNHAKSQIDKVLNMSKFADGNSWYFIQDYSKSEKPLSVEELQIHKISSLSNREDSIVGSKWFKRTTDTTDDSKKEIPVVVVDLDETFINNIEYQAYLFRNSKAFSPDSWEKWVASGEATLYNHVLDFVDYAHKKGVIVLFDSDRIQNPEKPTADNNEEKATVDNKLGTYLTMKKHGYPEKYNTKINYWMLGVEQKGGLGEEIYKYLQVNYGISESLAKNASTAKESRFQYINDMTRFQIIMRVGDNLDDFSSLGSKYNYNYDESKGTYTRSRVDSDQRNVFATEILAKHFADVAPEIRFNPATPWVGNKRDSVSTSTYEPGLESYIFIGGNTAYGGWLDAIYATYAKKTTTSSKTITYENVVSSYELKYKALVNYIEERFKWDNKN